MKLLWIVLGILSVGGAAFSRKNLGYFDKISLAAIFKKVEWKPIEHKIKISASELKRSA